MGGALKSIGGAIGGVIKQVAPAVIKAVAPAATGILKGIVGDAFQAVATGKATPAQALTEAEKQVNAILAKNQ